MAADVTGNFAAPGRVSDVDRVLEVECLDEFGKVVGVGVKVIAVPWLTRSAMSAAIMGDAAIAVGGQEEHLVLESVRAEWPAVAEHDGLPRAPVVEIDFSPVLGGDGAHVVLLRWVAPPFGRTSRPSRTCHV